MPFGHLGEKHSACRRAHSPRQLDRGATLPSSTSGPDHPTANGRVKVSLSARSHRTSLGCDVGACSSRQIKYANSNDATAWKDRCSSLATSQTVAPGASGAGAGEERTRRGAKRRGEAAQRSEHEGATERFASPAARSRGALSGARDVARREGRALATHRARSELAEASAEEPGASRLRHGLPGRSLLDPG